MGGGTPSLIGAILLTKILDALTSELDFEKGSEATVEANPSNTTEPLLSALVEAGYDRLSIGAQSLSNKRLAELDRLHSSGEALVAIERARAAGFRSVSADLLYGVPDQTVPEFSDGLKTAFRYGSGSCFRIRVNAPRRAGRSSRAKSRRHGFRRRDGRFLWQRTGYSG